MCHKTFRKEYLKMKSDLNRSECFIHSHQRDSCEGSFEKNFSELPVEPEKVPA